jgi:putative nucleotidyltransferase with HDIG domain
MYLLRHDQIKFCVDIDLYIKPKDEFVLYKAGFYSKDPTEHPDHKFYISEKDRNQIIHKMQDDFSSELSSAVANKNPKEIKRLMSGMMENALSLPEPEVLNGIKQPFTQFVDMVIDYPDIIKKILKLAANKYSTIEHSFNVAALALNYCMESPHLEHDCFGDYAMAGLFHDIGKSAISSEILDSPNKLSQEEYQKIQQHPTIGVKLLQAAGFSDSILQGALEHHLKMDGSGYPSDSKPTGEIGKLIGIADTYEALTNSNRVYRKPMNPIQTLELIKVEVEDGKYDEDIFRNFVKSLLDKNI